MQPLSYLLSALLLIFSFHAYAEINTLSQAINESGRLRMLSQRVAKAYILSGLDIQPEKSQRQLNESKTLFETNLAELRQFSSSINKPIIDSHIESIEQIWGTYTNMFYVHFNAQHLPEILMLSDATLLASEELVKQLESLSNTSSAHLVSIAGRQRMLSQRIAKLYSAMSASSDKNLYAGELLLAVNEFDSALNELIQSKRNTNFVSYKLKKVSSQWDFSKQGFKALDSGNSTPLVIAITTETILQQMNDITDLYEEIDKTSQSPL